MSTTYKRDDLLLFLRNVEAMVASIMRKQGILSDNKGLSVPEQDSLRKQIVSEKQALANFLATMTAPFLLAVSGVATPAQWNMLFEWMLPTVAIGLLSRLSHEDRDRLRSHFTSRIWGKIKDAYTSHGKTIRNSFAQNLPEDYVQDLGDLEFYRKKLARLLQILASDVQLQKPSETLRWVTYACLCWAQKYDGLGSSLLDRCKRQDMRVPGAREACQQVSRLYNVNMFRSAFRRVQELIPNAMDILRPEWKRSLPSLQSIKEGVVLDLNKTDRTQTVPGPRQTVALEQEFFSLFQPATFNK